MRQRTRPPLLDYLLRTRVVDMDMVRPSKDLWGLSPSLPPWGDWAVLTDPFGRSRPGGPPRSLRDG